MHQYHRVPKLSGNSFRNKAAQNHNRNTTNPPALLSTEWHGTEKHLHKNKCTSSVQLNLKPRKINILNTFTHYNGDYHIPLNWICYYHTHRFSQKLRRVFALLVKENQDVDRTNQSHFHRDWMQKVSSGASKPLLKLLFCEQTWSGSSSLSSNLFLDLVGLKNDFLMALHHTSAD